MFALFLGLGAKEINQRLRCSDLLKSCQEMLFRHGRERCALMVMSLLIYTLSTKSNTLTDLVLKAKESTCFLHKNCGPQNSQKKKKKMQLGNKDDLGLTKPTVSTVINQT